MSSNKGGSELPSVGFAMISYNDEGLIGDCLRSIYGQDYPRNKIQVVIADGGSTDKTLEIIERYGANVILRPDLVDVAYERGRLAAEKLNTDFQIAFSADNRFQEKDCLKKMIELFSDPEIVGVETLHYGARKDDPVLSRYFALIGGVDPVAIGLGKADRAPHDKNNWHSFGQVEDEKGYFKVTFSKDLAKIPTLGANGFIFRRNLMKAIGGLKNCTHIDACAKLIELGHNKFAFIKDRHILHYIDIPIWMFIKRRIAWAELYSPDNIKRGYRVFAQEDLPKLIMIVLLYPTIIVPFSRALIGFIKIPDPAWFLHIIVAPAFVWGYGLMLVRNLFKKLKIKTS